MNMMSPMIPRYFTTSPNYVFSYCFNNGRIYILHVREIQHVCMYQYICAGVKQPTVNSVYRSADMNLNLCGYGSTVDWMRTQWERMLSTSAMGSFSLHH